MNAPPPITVAMPVYNGAKYVARAVTAVQRQEFSDFEVVVRDNASTDDTEQIVRELIRGDPRFRYVRNAENVGGARNSNLLLAEARTPTVIWAYHDDEPHPRLLGDSWARLRDDPKAVVAFPRVQLIDDDGIVVGRHRDADLEIVADRPHLRLRTVLRRVVTQVQFGLMRTEAVRAAGGVSQSVAGEMVVPAAMALRGRLVLSSVTEPRLSIRQHAGRSGGDRRSEAVWADPDRPNLAFPYSRSTADLLQAVSRAPLSGAERRRAYRTVLWHWTRPQLPTLANDLVHVPWDAGWVRRGR